MLAVKFTWAQSTSQMKTAPGVSGLYRLSCCRHHRGSPLCPSKLRNTVWGQATGGRWGHFLQSPWAGHSLLREENFNRVPSLLSRLKEAAVRSTKMLSTKPVFSCYGKVYKREASTSSSVGNREACALGSSQAVSKDSNSEKEDHSGLRRQLGCCSACV